LGLCIGWRVPRKRGGLVVVGLGHARLETLVDEEPPDLLVRDMPDELLDVDTAIAKRATFAVGLGDLGLDCDDALEPRLEVRDLAHPPETLPEREFASVQLRS